MAISSYTSKSAATRAAKKALGGEAVPGQDFNVTDLGGGKFAWAEVGAHPDARIEGSAPARRASKPAPAPAGAEPKERRHAGMEAAKAGKLPEPPDFSAKTHERFRGKLESLIAMVKAKDVAGLKAEPINPISSSPKALDRYRNLAVTALEAKAAKAKGAATAADEPI
jgi:hypothetical protein